MLTESERNELDDLTFIAQNLYNYNANETAYLTPVNGGVFAYFKKISNEKWIYNTYYKLRAKDKFGKVHNE